MLKKALVVTALIIPFNNVIAGAIDFRVSRDVAEASFYTQNSSFGYGGADMGFGVLVNDDNDFIASGSILVSGNPRGDIKALHFGVGAKVYGGNIDGPGASSLDVSGGALAIGGRVRYVFPGSTPLAVLGEIFYAPDVTSVSDFDGLTEFRMALELEVTPSARAYVGYRREEITFNSSYDYKVDDSAHIGVRFEF